MIGIYKIVNTLNDKVYIGQTINIDFRFYEHKRKLRLKQHYNSYLQNAYNKYGECFSYEIIEECSLEELDEREIYWINYYKSNNREYGYNIMSGGQSNRCNAQESRDKISKPVLCIETDIVYPSIEEAQRQTGFGNISLACRRKIKHVHHTHWCFVEDATEEHIKEILSEKKKVTKRMKPILCVETGEIFMSLTEASESKGCNLYSLSRCLNHPNEYKTCKGYHWEFYDNKEVA